jgi:hypothetical protein
MLTFPNRVLFVGFGAVDLMCHAGHSEGFESPGFDQCGSWRNRHAARWQFHDGN